MTRTCARVCEPEVLLRTFYVSMLLFLLLLLLLTLDLVRTTTLLALSWLCARLTVCMERSLAALALGCVLLCWRFACGCISGLRAIAP